MAPNIIALDFAPRSDVGASPTILNAIDELILAKTLTNRRPKYLQGLRSYLMLFCEGREDIPIARFSSDDIDRWFQFRMEIPSSRNSNIGRLSSLFEFARRKKWTTENICSDIEKGFVEKGTPKILTVEQCELLMDRVQRLEPTLIPYFALALFMGIRPEEIGRLQSINIGRGVVEISSAASKTRQRRLVTINLTALEWLKINSKLPITNFRRKFRRVRFDLVKKNWVPVIPWSHDVLRHTAASMLYEKHGAVYTSKELGHSESILFSNYRELVTATDSERFWNIRPKTVCLPDVNDGKVELKYENLVPLPESDFWDHYEHGS